MSLPDYQVVVVSQDSGLVVAIYDSPAFDSLRYSRKVNDIGTFVLVFPYTDSYYNAFSWDNFVEIRRTNPLTGHMELEESYLVRARHRFREDNDERLVVGGMSLNHLLARRIINPLDDPTALDGYSVKSGPADTVMRDYVREQAADLASAIRQFPGMSVPAVPGGGATINKSFRYDNLFNAMQEMAVGSAIDFQVLRTDYYYTEVVIGVIGTDKTRTTNEPLVLPWLGLSPQRGNLDNPSLKIDRTDEKNYVYVLGQGQGEQRIVVEDYTTDVVLTRFNRIEFVKDQRNVDKTDTSGLTSSATEQLNKNKVKNDFTFDVSDTNQGSIYRADWELGDKGTAIWDQEELDLRITGVEIEIDSSGEQVAVSVETIYA